MKITHRNASVIVMATAIAVFALQSFAAAPTVANITAQQHAWPSTDVDIYYDLSDVTNITQSVSIAVSTNSGAVYNIRSANFTGDIGTNVVPGTQKHIVWDAFSDVAEFSSSTVRVQIKSDNTHISNLYMIVDLSGGRNATNYPVTFRAEQPPLNDEYKTTKILLHRIPAGTYIMGTPSGELGRYNDEKQHNVTLTKDFYISVFEITQAQFSNIFGINYAYFYQGGHAPKRPIENILWYEARGGDWPGTPPGSGLPDTNSFVGYLCKKTGRAFDLPTEAQWEYACRAGTTKALNNNMNLQSTVSDPNMDMLGRYWYNGASNGWNGSTLDRIKGGTSAVGSYLPNNWGLYDMHGNVFEFCLDLYSNVYTGLIDPVGPTNGDSRYRALRGGWWNFGAGYARSGQRYYFNISEYTWNCVGFRVICTP